ncbi:MAG TPA: site-2 protease family protein [Thermoanaerobaculia bacterium]|jgi:membrane-associated protease RseP (regulator of RpoE activity)|nr:site-2 protease family protein [Thermoanaerobaculia bacterium]
MSDGTRDWRQRPPFPPPLIELLPAPGDVFAAAPPRLQRPRYGLALLLFGLTFFCTTTLGPIMVQSSRTDMLAIFGPFLTPGVVAQVWLNPELLRLGLAFSVPALIILLAHELGHYIACLRYGLPCTLPYFLPVPFNFGTFGAFIKIKAPIRGKRQLFDVGIAGPIAGFVALVPFLLYGVANSHPAALSPAANLREATGVILLPGRCLAIDLATWLFHGRLGEGMVLDLHPMALAAWLGLLATAINLLPLGQLDGGHILYAATGRLQRRLALPLWLALAVLGYFWAGWLLWCFIVMLIGLYHPPVYDESEPLGPRRRALAWLGLILFALSFMPVPIQDIPVR